MVIIACSSEVKYMSTDSVIYKRSNKVLLVKFDIDKGCVCFQLHVLSYTVWCLIHHQQETLKPGDLDPSLSALTEVRH